MLTREPEQRLEGSHGRTAPVEAEDELVEVMRQVFLAHAAMGAPDPRREVSEDAMDPGEQRRRLFRRPFTRVRCITVPAVNVGAPEVVGTPGMGAMSMGA